MSYYPGAKGSDGVFQRLISLMPPHRTYIEACLGTGIILRTKRPAAVNIGLDLDPASPYLASLPGGIAASAETSRLPGHSEPGALVRSDDARGTPKLTSPAEIRRWVDRLSPDATSRAREASSVKTGDTAGGIATPGVGISSFPKFGFAVCDAITFLACYPWKGDELVYADPPYLRSTRRSPLPLYRFEFTTEDHKRLVAVLKKVPAMVMISGYWSDLYAKLLKGWSTTSFTAMTRRGPATEWVWCNFEPPTRLHDYRFLGRDFRERERIGRKIKRWAGKLKGLPVLERQAILAALTDGSTGGNGDSSCTRQT
jgi:hypothetical protein